VIGSRVKLAWTLQGFVVIILIVTTISELLDRVDYMVIIAGPFTPKIIMVITVPVPLFSVFSVVVAMRIAIIESPTIIAIIFSSRRVVGLLAPSDVFSD